jgi:hypothetical protein
LDGTPVRIEAGDSLKNDPSDCLTDFVSVQNPRGADVPVFLHEGVPAFVPVLAGYHRVIIDNGVYDPDTGEVLNRATVKYDGFRVLVEADEAVVWLPYDGATIPTVVQTGREILLPDAKAVVLDAEGIIDEELTEELSFNRIRVSVSGKGDLVPDVGSPFGSNDYLGLGRYSLSRYRFQTEQNTARNYLIRYTAEYVVGGKVLKSVSRDFTVQTQREIQNTERPILNLTDGMPSEANFRTKITLPKATAIHSLDKNVRIDIEVIDPNGSRVKAANDDDIENIRELDGFAVFENHGNRSFYPFRAGTYTVMYTVTTDIIENTPNAEARTERVEFRITVSNHSSPTIIIEEEDRIATVWGRTVFRRNPDFSLERPVSTNNPIEQRLSSPANFLYIPVARAWDSLFGSVPSVSIELRDPRGTTFFNTDDPGRNNPSADLLDNNPMKVVRAPVTREILNYYFDISSYNFASSSPHAGESVFVTYILSYRTRSGGMTATRSFSITVNEEFRDTSLVRIVPSDISEILWTGDRFDRPTVNTEAGNNSRVILNEVFKFQGRGWAEPVPFEYITVERDETTNVRIWADNTDRIEELKSLIDNRGTTFPVRENARRDLRELELKSLMFLFCRDGYVIARSAGEIIIELDAHTLVGNGAERTLRETVRVVSDCEKTDIRLEGTLQLAQMNKPVFENNNPSDTLLGYSPFVAGEEIELLVERGATLDESGRILDFNNSGIRILANEIGINRYLGFELVIRDQNGRNIPTEVSFTRFSGSDTEEAWLWIRQIKFTPWLEGIYEITLRATELNNKSVLATLSLRVVANRELPPWSWSNAEASSFSADFPNYMEAGARYVLPSMHEGDTFTRFGSDGNRWAEHITTIVGTRYEIKGNILTSFEAGMFVVEAFTREVGRFGNDEFRSESRRELVTVTDTYSPVFRMLTEPPLYKERFIETNAEGTGFRNQMNAVAETSVGGGTADFATLEEKIESFLRVIETHYVEIPEISVINPSGPVRIDTEVRSNRTASGSVSNIPRIESEIVFEYRYTEGFGANAVQWMDIFTFGASTTRIESKFLDETFGGSSFGRWTIDESRTQETSLVSLSGRQFFKPELDGIYTITYRATNQNGKSSTHTAKVTVGDLVAPEITFRTDSNRMNDITLSQNMTFTFANIRVSDNVTSSSLIKVTKSLIASNGEVLLTCRNVVSTLEPYKLTVLGTYRIRYEAEDEAGNIAVVEDRIVVVECNCLSKNKCDGTCARCGEAFACSTLSCNICNPMCEKYPCECGRTDCNMPHTCNDRTCTVCNPQACGSTILSSGLNGGLLSLSITALLLVLILTKKEKSPK